MIESRIAEGLTHWPHLAAEAGLPEKGWQPDLLSSRRDQLADRVVVRLRHPDHGAVVLKQGFGKGGQASVGNSIAPQQRAASMLAGKGPVAVPKILAARPELGAILMSEAEGQRLADLVDHVGMADALERAGEWLDAFHRAGRVQERAFQPRFMQTHLRRVADEALAGKRAIPRAEDFANSLAKLDELAVAARDARTVSSVRHGDLNARNLLIDARIAWGIDFGEAGEGPVGYDIARLLVHLTELSARPPSAELVQRPLQRAFFGGYKLTKRRDGSLPFLYYARLMSDWASLAAPEDELTLFKTLRLERIAALAKAVVVEA